MRKILLICMSSVLLTACDSHQEFPDTAMKVGHILCTDGQVLPYARYKESGKEAVGVVFYLNRDSETEGKGYALYLYDMASEAFADSIGVNQGTSADVTAMDGNSNNFAVFHTTEDILWQKACLTSGATDKVPISHRWLNEAIYWLLKADVNQSIDFAEGIFT